MNTADVKKIILIDSRSGWGHTTELVVEIVYEYGQWNSYQQEKLISDISKDSKDSVRRKLTTVLNTANVNEFLNSVTTIKPFNWRDFNITAKTLKADSNGIRAEYSFAPNLVNYITDQTVQEALTVSRKSIVYDDESDCSIMIVKNDGTTLKIRSQRPNLCMLPWLVDKQESYDLNISRFIVLAMGTQDFPNKSRLQAGNIRETALTYLFLLMNTNPNSVKKY